MARPKKDTSEKYSKSLPPIRCTQNDYDQIVKKAQSAGQSLTSYIREMALHGKITVMQSSVDFELLQELRRSGNNLNQLTKLYHSTGQEPIELRDTIETHNVMLTKAIGKL